MKGIRWAVSTLVLFGSAVVGCGPTDSNNDGITDGVREPDSVTLVAPSTPVGSVSGKALTTRMTPLDGATVTLSVPSRPDKEGNRALLSSVTDADGNFFIPGVPAGVNVEATIKKEGFATVYTRTTVPASAGNFPINDGNASVGPFAVTQLNGSLSFNVFTRSGRPATNARVIVEASPAYSTLTSYSLQYGDRAGVVVAEGAVGADGRVTVTGLPSPEELSRMNGGYEIIIPSHDENGDGVIDSAGYYNYLSGPYFVENGNPLTVTLDDARANSTFRIVSTNVPTVNGFSGFPSEAMVKPSEALIFAFSHALLPGSVNVRVTNEASTEAVTTTHALSADGTVVTASAPGPWADGKEYNVQVRGTSADTGEVIVRTGFFWGGDPNAPQSVIIDRVEFVDTDMDMMLTPGEQVYVYFSSPVVRRTNPGFGSETLFAYVNFDQNASGIIGDSAYEVGAPYGDSGFSLNASEPVGPDPIFYPSTQGITGRWAFSYHFALSGHPNIPVGTAVRIDFDRQMNNGTGLYSAWGALLTNNLPGQLVRRAP